MKEICRNMNAFILAGGQSRRFGEDKALYRYRGRPLIDYPVRRLSHFFPETVVIAKDAAPYDELGYVVLEDLLPYRNPLAGIYTGLRHSEARWNFFLACDMPMVTEEIVRRLASAVTDAPKDSEIVLPASPHGLQPLAAFYHGSLADNFVESVRGVRSLKGFIRSRKAEIVVFESDQPFVNVNTKEQLQGIN